MDQIFEKIQEYANSDNKNLEIEVKFRELKRSDYLFLKDYLTEKYPDYNENYIIDYYLKNNQRISENNDKFKETSKKTLFTDFYRNLKFNVSIEKNNELSIDRKPEFNFKRSKKRLSFLNGNFSLDLTYIQENDNYEFEIEILDPKKYSSKDFKKITLFYQNLLFSYKEDLIVSINNLLSQGRVKNNKFINRSLISRPRDLKKSDLISRKSILQNFTVSVKADGVQYFLLFHKSGIWLYSPNKGFIKVSHLLKEYQDLNETLFVGELLDEKNLKDKETLTSRYLYLPFDCLGYKGESIVDNNYLERIEKIKDVIEKELFYDGASILKIEEKRIFLLGDKSETFYKGFNECFDSLKEVIYKEDGFIFTPIYSSYVASGQFQKKERTLDKVLDVCKFKPIEKRSLDFLVKDGNLYLYTGDDLKKFKTIPYTLDFTEDLDDKIVEFFPDLTGKDIRMFPVRIRYDKEYPNTVSIANEIVKSYYEKNPITTDTLRGKDTVLMRSYNNMKKRNLLKSASGYVIDIGSGKGGDLEKYSSNSRVEKVLLVEPNKEYYKELLRRLEYTKRNDIFDTLLAKGEDTLEIVNKLENFFSNDMKDKDLTLTFMISLTFFWANEKELNKLIATISSIQNLYRKRNGNRKINLLYYTIDGHKVQRFFSFKIGEVKHLNTITMSLVGENQVYISIKDSKTVKDQTEYLVKLDQFFQKVKLNELFQDEPDPPDDLLMSKSERIYLSLHTFGEGRIGREIKISIPPLQRLVVSETDAFYDRNNKIIAIGDDKTEKIYYLDSNLRRISCLNMNFSIVNCILKLTSREYRHGDVFTRSNMAREKYDKLEMIDDFEYLSKEFNLGIKVFYGNKSNKFGLSMKEWILINQCEDMTYEPIIYVDNKKIFYSFDKNSYLI